MNTAFNHAGLTFNLSQGTSGTAIVFQHGLCGSAAQTEEAFPDDPRFKRLTLECRGHGGSEAGSHQHFAIPTFATDVAAMIAAHAKPRCIVGGISMGAAIALHLAVHQPHLVKALVLARPAWIAAASPDNIRPNTEVGELLSQHSPREAEALFLKSATAEKLRRDAPDNLASLQSFFHREPIATTSALLRAIANDGPHVTEQQVSSIRVPTLVIGTAQDVIHPLHMAETLHRMIPQSTLAVLTPKGENKQRYTVDFRAALLRFFEEHA
jgi:pimeloyl-ACP methyl ester carboxylesterase